jgi:hypothetical protein
MSRCEVAYARGEALTQCACNEVEVELQIEMHGAEKAGKDVGGVGGVAGTG